MDEFPHFVADAVETASAPILPDSRSVEISLMSTGKLSLPYKIHIRDLNMDDANRLAMATDETLTDTLITVLGSIIQEKVDPAMIHEEEAKQIMLFILLNFWSNSIDQYPYDPDSAEAEHLKATDEPRYLRWLADQETIWVKIPLVDGAGKSVVNMNPLADAFLEPFALPGKTGGSFAFRLPRLGDLQKAQKKVDAEYATQDLELYDVKEALIRISQLKNRLRDLQKEESADDTALGELREKIRLVQLSIKPERKRAYDDLVKKKTILFLGYKQALALVARDGVEFTSDEDRFAALPDVSANMWTRYQSVVARYKFGIDGKMKLTSPITGGPVEREVRFRLMDVVPTIEFGDDRELEVSFGSLA